MSTASPRKYSEDALHQTGWAKQWSLYSPEGQNTVLALFRASEARVHNFTRVRGVVHLSKKAPRTKTSSSSHSIDRADAYIGVLRYVFRTVPARPALSSL